MNSYGQEGIWKPFKLLVIQPDTAIVDKSFSADEDSIVAIQLRRYYKQVETMERVLNCVGCGNDSAKIAEMKVDLARLKSYEPEARNFKFFHLISSYSTEIYNFYFNEYPPLSTIVELRNRRTDLANLKLLADTAKADYILFFNNIHTTLKNEVSLLKLTTLLYSRKENKIILAKKTEGDGNSRGEMWDCDMNVQLSCLFINAVRTSTDEVANILRKRQIRAK